MKKNIVLIRNAQPYDFGGGERFPVFVSQVLKKQGYNPTIVSRSDSLRKFAGQQGAQTVKGWWWRHQNWSGVWALLFPIYFVWQIVLSFYYVFLFIRLRPRVIHIQSKDDFIAATIAGKLLARRVIWTDHADLKHIWRNVRVWYKNPVGKLVYVCAQLADSITVVSKSERSLVLKNVGSQTRIAKKLRVIYNGAFDHYTSKDASDRFVYICTSRLVTDKGIGELIEAFLAISPKQKDAELWIVGEGRERTKFEELAGNNKRVRFLGQQSDPLSLLRKASVFVHPTHHEGFSLAVVEASMMGLPIIATRVGGNPEIIFDQKTGLLVEPRDTASLATAMTKLYKSQGLRNKLGAAARKQYVAKFNFEDIVIKKFIPLYEGRK